MQHWKTLSSTSVHKNPWSEVFEDRVVRPDGSEGVYYVVRRHPFCGIIPIDSEHKIHLVRQERYPIGRAGWEIPQGQVDPGEDVVTAAHRELAEETGLSAEKLEHIGEMAAEKGLQDQLGQIFIANVSAHHDASQSQLEEGITAHRAFTMAEVQQLLIDGEIQCTFTASALYLAQIKGFLPAR